jgi:hypothetical protein
MVPCCSAPSANMQREGDDVREERPDRFLSGRAHLGAPVAECHDDVVHTREVVDRLIDAVRCKAEIVGQASPRDPGDELAAAARHGRQAQVADWLELGGSLAASPTYGPLCVQQARKERMSLQPRSSPIRQSVVVGTQRMSSEFRQRSRMSPGRWQTPRHGRVGHA